MITILNLTKAKYHPGVTLLKTKLEIAASDSQRQKHLKGFLRKITHMKIYDVHINNESIPYVRWQHMGPHLQTIVRPNLSSPNLILAISQLFWSNLCVTPSDVT